MRVDAVIFVLLSLIEVFPLAFIFFYFLKSLGIAACLGSIEDNIQINVGRCLPHMWGFQVGRIKNPATFLAGFWVSVVSLDQA